MDAILHDQGDDAFSLTLAGGTVLFVIDIRPLGGA
jgi:hypothetical protein